MAYQAALGGYSGHFDKGLAAYRQGLLEIAVQALRRASFIAGPSLEANDALAGAWRRLGRRVKALETLLKALALDPANAVLRNQIAEACGTRFDEPLPPKAVWTSVVDEINPRGPFDGLDAATLVRRADALQALGRLGPALDCCLTAIVLEPEERLHQDRAANVLFRLNRLADGLRCLQRLDEVAPTPDRRHRIGDVLQTMGDYSGARSAYERALQLDKDFVPSLCALGHLLQEQCEMTNAERYLSRAFELDPDPVVRVLLEAAVPPVYESLDELRHWRRRISDNVARLVSENVTIDPATRTMPTTFYTAYHGVNDRSLAEAFGRIYRPETSRPVRRRVSSRIRVGMLSHYFRTHTIGRLNLGTVRELSRENFEVFVISTQKHFDRMASEFARYADQYVVLSPHPRDAADELSRLGLDVLLFTDVGMDPLTYSLAFMRSAPLQCATWGHPVTTGSPEMDYFISSERLEVPHAQEHYTESLVRLPDVAVCYSRLEAPCTTRDRTHFGFSADDRLYGCLQTLFKIHPEFDDVLAQILERDPQGILVLIEGRRPEWTERLRRRLSRRLADRMTQVRFLQPLAWEDFLSLAKCVDVHLDPIHFGGGNTTYEALALGTPVVSLPGEFLRGRITAGLYSYMELSDFIVQSAHEYVELALRLANDRESQEDARRRILARNRPLFDNVSGIRQLEQFWRERV